MSWKQKWPQNHKTSKCRMSSLESSGLNFHWLGCTRYQVDTVSLNHWRKPVLMSLTVTHIFITLQNLKAKYTTIVTTQVLGPMLGHVILQNAFFFLHHMWAMEQKAPSGFASSGLGLGCASLKSGFLKYVLDIWHFELKKWRFERWFSFSKSDFQRFPCYFSGEYSKMEFSHTSIK